MTPNKQPEWEEVAEKWLEKESVRVSVLTDLQTLIKEIISSRDTYWKERFEELHKKWNGKADSQLLMEIEDIINSELKV